jgi:ubiquinone/menaquinone biosynthesis C-methylase UbiE
MSAARLNEMSTPQRTETDRVRQIQDKQAAGYDRSMDVFERLLFAGAREWACAQLAGEVLEIAIGTGRNMSLYPHGIRVTGVELSPEMLVLARRRASGLDVDVDLRLGDAQRLEFADASFDTVLITFALCTIPDDRAAVGEAFRVLRPGGRLVAVEHVRSPVRAVRTLQRVLEPLSVRFGADHLTRDPLDYVADVGFRIDEAQRSKWGIVERLSARRPVGAAGSE